MCGDLISGNLSAIDMHPGSFVGDFQFVAYQFPVQNINWPPTSPYAPRVPAGFRKSSQSPGEKISDGEICGGEIMYGDLISRNSSARICSELSIISASGLYVHRYILPDSPRSNGFLVLFLSCFWGLVKKMLLWMLCSGITSTAPGPLRRYFFITPGPLRRYF